MVSSIWLGTVTLTGYSLRRIPRFHPLPRLNRSDACLELLGRYLGAALFVSPRKLHTLFHLLLSREEIETTIFALIDMGRAKRVRLGRTEVVVSRATSA
jgi:hypothetical protein